MKAIQSGWSRYRSWPPTIDTMASTICLIFLQGMGPDRSLLLKIVLFSPFLPMKTTNLMKNFPFPLFIPVFEKEGFAAIDRLLLRKEVPWFIKEQGYRNLLFYAKALARAKYLPIELNCPLTQRGGAYFRPMNAAILKTAEGYEVICRTVNYDLHDTLYFHLLDGDERFCSRNFLLSYDKQFQLLSQKEIVEDLPRERFSYLAAEGMEDCRFFMFKGKRWVSCTTSDTNPYGNFQISLCQIGEDAQVEELIPLLGPNPYRCEKNWLPFILNDEVYLIYSYDPFTIYRADEDGMLELVREEALPFDLSRFRGSAPPIAFDGGYLILVHEAIYPENAPRFYLHRFLFLDQWFELKSISKPFIFQHFGTEFCCGMTLDHSGEKLIFSITSKMQQRSCASSMWKW